MSALLRGLIPGQLIGRGANGARSYFNYLNYLTAPEKQTNRLRALLITEIHTKRLRGSST